MKTRNVLIVLALIVCQGCAAIRPDGWGTEWKHDSVLLAGEPFTKRKDAQGQKVEDSLDVWNNYLFWDRPTWYAELGLGYKLREGGFYVKPGTSPIIVNSRAGKRFRFTKR